MAITREDIEIARKLLARYAQNPTLQALMDETEFVARGLGDLPRSRAARLIVAARQDVTTADLRKKAV